MITLNLLHPTSTTPAQSWTFDNESIVRIGRAKEQHVVVHSAVVSRLHVELQRQTAGWEVVSMGTNGTYVNGERITRTRVLDGMVIRLGTSGPKIQIYLGGNANVKPMVSSARTTPSTGTPEPNKIQTFLTGPKQSVPPEHLTYRED
ncbi:MAG: FHA domain-containing protein [Leptolyngbyaceae cyanobacterium bins.59]|nr:FHA domain-containing protein [Leptolyngbyaceae cyanobacterium bins.59]